MVGRDDFFTAIKEGQRDRVRAALAGDPGLLRARENGLSPILVALYHGEPAIAEDLVRHGPELDVFEAAAAGVIERVRELLDGDRSLADRYAADGFTPLGLASFFKRPDVVRELLDRGADPNRVARHEFAVAPIHSAVANGTSLAIVRMLVEAGAEVNVRQRHGWTPLHGAAMSGDADLVRYLLDRGADRAATNDQGKTAAAIARENGHGELAGLL